MWAVYPGRDLQYPVQNSGGWRKDWSSFSIEKGIQCPVMCIASLTKRDLSVRLYSFVHSVGMCRMQRFLAVLRSFFHSSLLCTFSCHPSPPTNYSSNFIQAFSPYLSKMLVWSLLVIHFSAVGGDSSVGIATRYGLDGPGIESRWGRDFPHLSRPALGPILPPVQWVRGLSRG